MSLNELIFDFLVLPTRVAATVITTVLLLLFANNVLRVLFGNHLEPPFVDKYAAGNIRTTRGHQRSPKKPVRSAVAYAFAPRRREPVGEGSDYIKPERAAGLGIWFQWHGWFWGEWRPRRSGRGRSEDTEV